MNDEINRLNVEEIIIVFSLINAAVFYAVTIIMFMVARHTPLNAALALQKFTWLLIIVVIALPSLLAPPGFLPAWVRAVLWSFLSVSTWFVLWQVYRANWTEPLSQLLKVLWAELKCRMGRRK